jgi:hypothetical protein
MRLPELSRTEIDARQGNVEACLELAEDAAVTAANFQYRLRLICRYARGDPFCPERAGLLAFLFAKIIIAAAECPVVAGIAV